MDNGNLLKLKEFLKLELHDTEFQKDYIKQQFLESKIDCHYYHLKDSYLLGLRQSIELTINKINKILESDNE